MENKYIIPTKENPVFRVINTYEGYIVNDCPIYKGWQVKNDQYWVCGETTAISLPGAMEALFKHIQNNPDKEAAKYAIEMIDGTVDKWGEPVYRTVYKISMKQARKFKIIGYE